MPDIIESLVPIKQTKAYIDNKKTIEASYKKALSSIQPKGSAFRLVGKTNLLKQLDITEQDYERIIQGRLELTDEQVITIGDITSTNRV